MQQIGRNRDGYPIRKMQRVQRQRNGRLIRRTSQQYRLSVADRTRLRPQCRQRCCRVGGILFRGQHVVARCAADLVACGHLPGALFTQRDQSFGCGDLFLKRGGVDRRHDDIGRERSPSRLKLVSLLLNLPG